jgi:hypothetical protein
MRDWSPGDSFEVCGTLPGVIIGKKYIVSSTYLQGGNRFITYIGDDCNFYDAMENIFDSRVVYLPPAINPYYVDWSNMDGGWLDIYRTPTRKKLACKCGATAVGVPESQLERHSHWCDLVTGKESA